MKQLYAMIIVSGALFAISAYSIELHGFLLGNYAARVTGGGAKPASGDFLLGEERLQLKLSGSNETGSSYFVKADFLHDAVATQGDLDIREGYSSHTTGLFDFSVGRQIHTWGTGDLLFINDVFPKDYSSLLSGRPMEYMKKGTTGIKTTFTSEILSFDLVIMPFFEADGLPDSNRFFLYDPFSGVTNRVEQKPGYDFANTELAFRLYRPILGLDAALYVYRGFFRMPSMQPDSMTSPTVITMSYPKLEVFGASVQGSALDGVVSLEAGYLDSREDVAGTNPLVPNSVTKYLIGYQRSLWTDFTAGIQYYGEYMHQYDRYIASLPAEFSAEGRLRHLLALRLTQLLKYQTWRLSWFSFYSPSDRDFYLIAETSYRASDEISVTMGGNIFGGARETTFFGQFRRNDNIYMNVRYDF